MNNKSLKHNIIYFSDASLDDGIWFITQRVGTILSHANRVLYVESPKPISEIFKDPRHLFKKIKKIIMPTYKRSANLYVFSPFYIFPFGRFKLVRNINFNLVIWSVKFLAKIFGFNEPILWLEQPSDIIYINHFRYKYIAYYCEHDFVTYPMYSKGEAFEAIKSQEEYLLRKSNIVFCTSLSILERKKKINPNIHHIPIGVDVEHFAKAFSEETAIPSDIRNVPHPIFGFVGALDKYKVDFDLLAYLAKNNSRWSFIMVGKIGSTDSTKLEELPQLDNIYYLGPRDKTVVPNYMKAFDACLIPYVLNEYTINLTTMKFFEYMATGKPIVMTDLPQRRNFGHLVKIAKSKEEFEQFLKQVLSENGQNGRNERIAAATNNSWERQVGKMLNLINNDLLKREFDK